MKRILMLSLITLSVAACASAGTAGAENAGPVVVEPAGRYEISVDLGGETRAGSLDVSNDGDGHKGRLQIPGLPPATITGARVVETGVIELDVELPEGVALLTMNFDEDGRFTGDLATGGQRLAVHGRRLERRTPQRY